MLIWSQRTPSVQSVGQIFISTIWRYRLPYTIPCTECRSDLHINHLEVQTALYDPLYSFYAIYSIEIGSIAGVVPPPTFVSLCTLIIVVSIVCTESITIVVCHSISVACPTSCSQCECVVRMSPTNLYCLVCPIEGHTISGLHIDPQLHLPAAGEVVNVPQPIPELSLQVPEALLIVLPVAGGVGGAIGEPSLND